MKQCFPTCKMERRYLSLGRWSFIAKAQRDRERIERDFREGLSFSSTC